jgi:aminomuconate-semialdehyde/2-hydroxymuconate-6-semialdehyde dehydrogenase
VIVIKNYIGGQLQPPCQGQYFDSINPATALAIAHVPDSDEEDVELAVKAAESAFQKWSTTAAEERMAIMLRWADTIEARLEEFAQAETMDNGKPISVSRSVDIPRSVQNIRFFASACLHVAQEAHFNEGHSAVNYTMRRPVGVVGCISPWNLPLYLFTWKIAPAIAAGCCVIGKPSEVTPLTSFLLAETAIEAGIPAGVLSIIHGTGPKVGAAIVKHPKIKAISFTGSTRAGEEIAKVAAPMFKKLSLELGGKNPTAIFDDCDFEHTVNEVARAAFSNQGQICLCASRIYIQKSLYPKFLAAFIEEVKKLVPGNPQLPETRIGAIVSELHYNKVLGCIELAKQEGGTVLLGGKSVKLASPLDKGYYIEPTIIEGLNNSCRTNQEEIFGPVVSVQPFEDEADFIRLANESQYGLATSVWTSDISRGHRVAERLECGIVWINCWMLRDLRTPFGGVKNSGVGREGGWEAMRFFTEPKNVCIKYTK